jgi:two-component system sensor histidine kinase TctE
VREIAELHRAEVELLDAPGNGGLIVRVSFPRVVEPVPNDVAALPWPV